MSLPYYLRYPDAFLEATDGWPGDLKGAYGILLDLIYRRDGKLVDDAGSIAGHLGYSVRKWNLLKKQLIEKGKIKVVDGIIRNTRADDHLISRRSFQEKQAINRSRPNKINDEGSPPSTYARALSGIRGDSDESPSEAGASAAEPPRGDLFETHPPPEAPAKPADLWTVGARILNPSDPGWAGEPKSKEWRSARDKGVGLLKQVVADIRADLNGDAKAADDILRKVVLATEENGSGDIAYMRKTAKNMVAELRKPKPAAQSAQDAPDEELQFDGDGRAWFVNSKSGARRPVAGGKVAA
jgi:hypothetical protein